MLKILHIINDEKFVNDLIKNYESAPRTKSIYLVITHTKSNELKYVKPIEGVVISYYKELGYFLKLYCDSELFIFHGLDRTKLKALKSLSRNKSIVVHFWGADIYLLPKFRGKLLKKETRNLFKKKTSPYLRIKDHYRGFYYEFLYRKHLDKVSYYSTVIPIEAKFISKYMSVAKFINFNYVDIESLKLKHFIRNEKATDVLIGNSSSYTSNHIDILNIINKIKALKTAKKILPLNYGDALYASEVKGYVKKNKLENVITLTEFLPPDEYVRVLSNCSIAIMYHQRQQAVGTILICLWLGMRLFLSENNPVYNYYKDKGMVLFSIEKELSQLKQSKLLNLDDIENNRDIIQSIYSKDKSQQNIIDLVNLVTNE